MVKHRGHFTGTLRGEYGFELFCGPAVLHCYAHSYKCWKWKVSSRIRGWEKRCHGTVLILFVLKSCQRPECVSTLKWGHGTGSHAVEVLKW